MPIAVNSSSLACVLVVPADPHLERVALVPPLRRPVEDPVVAHRELDAAGRGRVGLVDGAVVKDECAEALDLGEVARDIGAGRVCVVVDDRRRSCAAGASFTNATSPGSAA